jgi:biopolymer transport protein ExbB
MFQDTSTPGTIPPAAPADVAALPTGLGGNNNAQALKQMGFEHLIQNLDAVGWIVFLTLLAFSVLSIYFIVLNLIRNTGIRARMATVMRTFWETPSAQEAIRFMEEQPKSEPFSKIALDCASAAAHHQRHEGSRLVEALNRSEFIDRALRQAVARESGRLENGLTVLATVGSTAPFVGLLGTVWGIYHALIKIGATGQASIDAVAGPVGEALIMTAFGLFVAIPAVLAYNFFVRSNRVIYARFDEFAHDLHDFFATGSRVEAGAVVPAPRAGQAAPAARK